MMLQQQDVPETGWWEGLLLDSGSISVAANLACQKLDRAEKLETETRDRSGHFSIRGSTTIGLWLSYTRPRVLVTT